MPSADALHANIDPIWTSSRTARQIYSLGEVEKDIARLLSLASSSVALLTLPQTDPPDSTLPQGEERSEQFVLEVSEYFELLDQIHINIRSTLAQIRQSRIAPSAINAPPPNFIPQPSGVGTPSLSTTSGEEGPERSGLTKSEPKRGLQEERINRDAWKGILEALQKLKAARERDSSRMDTS
ncbi:hypothetical protein SCHPADRAFT_914616 [Schizopora paradoxa]|uniref:Mediator of RNA polymerase II transcription subunit 11 n=1 Tax=Schizopora paradoxa TaxID=27342 RepID=A0A0H2RTY9_9AGAM|nr:hypothetical protein SCHPADRAFT_914616 [Schizopora paradoxa]